MVLCVSYLCVVNDGVSVVKFSDIQLCRKPNACIGVVLLGSSPKVLQGDLVPVEARVTYPLLPIAYLCQGFRVECH